MWGPKHDLVDSQRAEAPFRINRVNTERGFKARHKTVNIKNIP